MKPHVANSQIGIVAETSPFVADGPDYMPPPYGRTEAEVVAGALAYAKGEVFTPPEGAYRVVGDDADLVVGALRAEADRMRVAATDLRTDAGSWLQNMLHHTLETRDLLRGMAAQMGRDESRLRTAATTASVCLRIARTLGR
jgi:hypothetical protein